MKQILTTLLVLTTMGCLADIPKVEIEIHSRDLSLLDQTHLVVSELEDIAGCQLYGEIAWVPRLEITKEDWETFDPNVLHIWETDTATVNQILKEFVAFALYTNRSNMGAGNVVLSYELQGPNELWMLTHEMAHILRALHTEELGTILYPQLGGQGDHLSQVSKDKLLDACLFVPP